MSELSQTELNDIILKPVSKARKKAFFEGFCADREKAGTTRMLFDRSKALLRKKERPKPEEVSWSGFSLLLRKAPLVDLPNWAPYRTWDFAVAMEKNLLARFEQALREGTEGRFGDPVNRDAASVVRAFDDLAADLDGRGYTPSVLVMAGPLGSQLLVDLKPDPKLRIVVSDWEPQVKQALGTTFRIVNMYEGLPILHIPESPSPGLYVVDLARFATLTEYGEKPDFELEAIDDVRARDLLQRNPNLVPDSPTGPHSESEKARELQLKVFLKLYETYKLSVLDRNAVAGCPLTGPVLEWQPDYARA